MTCHVLCYAMCCICMCIGTGSGPSTPDSTTRNGLSALVRPTKSRLKPDSTQRAAPVLPLATSLRAPVRAAGSLPYSTARLHPSPGGTVRTETVLPDRRSTSSGPNLLQTGQMRMVAAAQRHGHTTGRRVPFIGNRVTGAADPPSSPPVDNPEDRCYLTIRNLPHTAGWAPTGGLYIPSGFFCVLRIR